MAQYTPEQLGLLDEVSKDERSPSPHYARSRKGRRAATKQPFVRGRRTSTEALLTLDGIMAGTVVEGSMMKAMFLEYLELNVVSDSCTELLLCRYFRCSFQNALHFRARSVSSSWTMQRFTMETRLLSLWKRLVCYYKCYVISISNILSSSRCPY